MARVVVVGLVIVLAAGYRIDGASAATYIQLDSRAGDYIGQGFQRLFTPADGAIDATASPAGDTVTVGFAGGALGSWDFEFDTASGAPLVAGSYGGATRYPFNAPTQPGLSVDGDGRGCNTLTGRFVVLEAAFTGATVDKLAIDFEQHCEGGVPALFGFVRVNSAVPISDGDGDGVVDIEDDCPYDVNPDQGDVDGDGIGNVCDATQGVTFIHFDSQPGDYIGAGQQQTLTLADGFITAGRNFDGGVSIGFQGSDFWTLDFAPPSGAAPFGPGTYEGAERFPFQSPTKPGLDVSGAGRGCNTLTGRFTVLEAVFDPTGTVVVAFAADFEQHCEGDAAALFGVVRYNATSVPAGFDRDGDGIVDPGDNCPDAANPDQADRDGDHRGDVCDPFPDDADDLAACLAMIRPVLDDDADGIPDTLDRCPGTPPGEEVDSEGCTQTAFCARWTVRRFCRAADWRNDEPARAHDCVWLHGGVGCQSSRK
jgi:hypothetical protein